MEKVTQTEGHLGNGSVEKQSLTFELVSQFFCMPIDEAAQELTMGLTSLKKRCRELGIPRWPCRQLRSLQELIDVVKELGKDDTPEKAEKTKMVVQKLQRVMKQIVERPDVELDKKTKLFRQPCYKEMYERRIKRKLALDTEELIEGAATLQHIAVIGHGGDAAMGQVQTEDD